MIYARFRINRINVSFCWLPKRRLRQVSENPAVRLMCLKTVREDWRDEIVEYGDESLAKMGDPSCLELYGGWKQANIESSK